MAGKRKPREYEIEIEYAKNGKTLEEALFKCSDLIIKLINEQLIWEKEQEEKLLLEQSVAE